MTRPCGLTIGSWRANLYTSRDELRDLLGSLFRQPSATFVDLHWKGSVPEVHLFEFGENIEIESAILARATTPVPADGFVTTRDSAHGVVIVRTEEIHALLVEAVGPERIYVAVRPGSLLPAQQAVHLSFVINTLLFKLGRLVLHAGAIAVGERAALLLGDRGAGKSTVCLRLGLAGATVLADDHTLLSRDAAGFHVSGCHGEARVTERTEAFLLAGQLAGVGREDYAGLLKKPFAMDRFCCTDAGRDYSVDRLLVLSVGDRFSLQPLSRHEVLPIMVAKLRSALRFNGARDYADYFDYLSDFVRQVQPWRVQLSPQLESLDRVVSFFGL